MVRFENFPRTEKGGPTNGQKKGASTNRFSEAFGSGWGEGRRSVRTPSALEIDDIVGGLARRAPRRGRRIEDAMRRAHRRPRDPGSALPLGTWWFMCGVSVRTVCAFLGSWQNLASSWQLLATIRPGALRAQLVPSLRTTGLLLFPRRWQDVYFPESVEIERYGTGSHRLLID